MSDGRRPARTGPTGPERGPPPGPGRGALGDFLAACAALDDETLAEAIEHDARERIAQGERLDLGDYLRAMPSLSDKPVSLDASIDMVLRSLVGVRRQSGGAVERLTRQFPHLEAAIRDAAALNAAMLTTDLSSAPTSRLSGEFPRPFGPLAEDGAPQYDLLRVLGQGSFGEVVLARDRMLSEGDHEALVAIKMLRPGVAGAEPGRRLMREAARARRVDHPNVAKVLQYGATSEGDEFIVYEFVDGIDLARWARTRTLPLPQREAARLVEQAARGVQAAHAAGLTHCDLKPSNIMITRDGTPKVIDFGIAVSDPGEAMGRGSSRPRGALGFIAPEQFRGEDDGATPASDVYALGGVLFWLLTGDLPNGATPEEVVRRHTQPKAESLGERLRSAAPRIGRDLHAICARATSARRAERYAAAAQFADDLEAWRLRQPLRWRRTSAARAAWLWARRSPLTAASIVAAALAIAAAAAVYVTLQARAVVARARAEEQDRIQGIIRESNRAMLEQYRRLVREGWEGASLGVTQVYSNMFLGPATAPEYTAQFVERNIRIARRNLDASRAEGPRSPAAAIWSLELARWLVSAGDADEALALLADLRGAWPPEELGPTLGGVASMLAACAEANALINSPPTSETKARAREVAARLEAAQAALGAAADGSLLRALALTRLERLCGPEWLADPARADNASRARASLIATSPMSPTSRGTGDGSPTRERE